MLPVECSSAAEGPRDNAVRFDQADAIRTGRGTAQREHTELFIHRRDGRIRDRDSFGNDAFPPRDTKPGAMWIVVAAVALASSGQLSRRPLQRRVA